METKHHGGCHCGAVRYLVDVDLAKPAISCNCSICVRGGTLLSFVPASQFTLVKGEDQLSDYQFNKHNIHHLFCKRCGVRSFGWGDMPEIGGKIYAVNVACLDGVDPAELASAPIVYIDGLHENWQQPPAETHLHDVTGAEVAAMAVLRRIDADIRAFRFGDPERGVAPGEPWAFLANPMSKLCSDRWCPAWGTSWCREHRLKEDA